MSAQLGKKIVEVTTCAIALRRTSLRRGAAVGDDGYLVAEKMCFGQAARPVHEDVPIVRKFVPELIRSEIREIRQDAGAIFERRHDLRAVVEMRELARFCVPGARRENVVPFEGRHPWHKVKSMNADVVDRAAVPATFKIPTWARAEEKRMLPVDANRADLADFPATNNFLQRAESPISSRVELQPDEALPFSGQAFDFRLLFKRGAKGLIAQHVAVSCERLQRERPSPPVVIANGNHVTFHVAEHGGEIGVGDGDASFCGKLCPRFTIFFAAGDDFGIRPLLDAGEQIENVRVPKPDECKARFHFGRRDAAAWSMCSTARGCPRRTEAGPAVSMGPSKVA